MNRKQLLRLPMAERKYSPVEQPIVVAVPAGFGQPPTKMPCPECPLARTAIRGALGGYTAAQYLEVLHGPADLACHLSKGFPLNRAEQRSCTGVAMYRANLGRLHPAGGAMRAVLLAGENRDAVFASPEEFAAHHDGRRDL
jgi:hypothetical protein